MVKLTEKQELAYKYMSDGNNIFLTGKSGSGKSEVIKSFVDKHKHFKIIAVTSTTGTSALLIGGTTLHSYLGIGLGTGSVDFLVRKIKAKKWIRDRWIDLDILIIDEISMLSPVLFDKLEKLARVIRDNTMPFGGIQLVLTGDFCQLPVIGIEDFCFEAKMWDKCIDKTVYLTEILRQTDLDFQDCLNEVRIGKLSKKSIQLLKSRVGVKLDNEFNIKPTKLFSLNKSVDALNSSELNKFASNGVDFYEYDMEFITTSKDPYMIDKFKKNSNVPEKIQLCIGAQVMLLVNLDLECQLANGSRGIITKFVDDYPMVKFLNGVERMIELYQWDIEENDVKIMSVLQLPLKIAYALTTHKSQGATIDYVELDMANIFEYGQAYVALSRVKSLEGLSLKSFHLSVIKSNPKVIEYYDRLIKEL